MRTGIIVKPLNQDELLECSWDSSARQTLDKRSRSTQKGKDGEGTGEAERNRTWEGQWKGSAGIVEGQWSDHSRPHSKPQTWTY